MKKTLTVNLGGTVFQLDEDAYKLLDNYLNDLRFHFRKEEGGEEIVRDMEMRISELFTENLEGGQQVITIDNVEAVIARMGHPEDLEDESGADYAAEATASQDCKNETAGGSSEKIERRLFRNVDDSILGGVLSGIAAYFGWDPTAVRLIYIMLGFLPGGPSVLIIYLILLFIIPPARTATEKLQMRGEPVNMENIGKTVTDGFERKNNPETAVSSRTGLQRFFDVIVSLVGILVKVFLAFLIICCVPFLLFGFIFLFVMVMSFFGVFVHLPSIATDVLPNLPWNSLVATPVLGFFFFLSFILSLGIPLVVVIHVILQHFRYNRPMSTWVKLTLIMVWFIALITSFVLFFVV